MTNFVYKKTLDFFTGLVAEDRILRIENGGATVTTIFFSSPSNEQTAYLAWLAEGNTPLPADEPT